VFNPEALDQPNPEVDPQGRNLPSKVQSLATSALRALIKSVFGVDLVGGDETAADPAQRSWTQMMVFDVYRTLYSLTNQFRVYMTRILREPIGLNNPNVAGYVWSNRPHEVTMCDAAAKYGVFREVLVHEMAHSFTFNNMNVYTAWVQNFWTPDGKSLKTPSVTAYGCTNPHEDIAESVKVFWQSGDALKQKDPARYEFVKKYFFNGREYSTSAR